MVRSPSWFLKILKLPLFYSGNLSQIALSNMWLLVQIIQIRRQYFSSTSTNILLIFFFSRLRCFVAFVVQSPNISKFRKQDETTKYYDRVPPTLPHKKGPGKVAVLKKIVILDFSKGGFFSLPNLKWFAEQRKQSLASLLYWEFESVEKLFDFEGGHFRL